MGIRSANLNQDFPGKPHSQVEGKCEADVPYPMVGIMQIQESGFDLHGIVGEELDAVSFIEIQTGKARSSKQ